MKTNLNAPSRPALRYHGAKWNLAPWIIQYIPTHELYCEPCVGSGGVIMRKTRSYLEVINDKDSHIVEFFRVLREHKEELINAIELTPYAADEWVQSFTLTNDPIENARRLYIRSYMSIAGPTAQWNTGWRRQKVMAKGKKGQNNMTPAAISFSRVDHLWTVAARLRGVTIENMDIHDVLDRYDSINTCFYVDPPYLPETRGRWKDHAYTHEMNEDDHIKLAKTLNQVDAKVLLSGYRSDLYDNLYPDWQRIDKETRINGPGSATESLWLSPTTQQALNYHDLPLFQQLHEAYT